MAVRLARGAWSVVEPWSGHAFIVVSAPLLALRLGFLVNPVVQTLAVAVAVSYVAQPSGCRNSPNNLDCVKLHADCKNGLILAVLELRVCPDDCAVVEVLDLLVVRHDKLAPLLFAVLALHLVLVYCGFRVKVGELRLEVLVDLIVELGEAQLGAGHLLEDLPVCLNVLHDCALSLAVKGGASHFEKRTLDSEGLLNLCRR
jgi:hypothetical protein